MKNTIHEYINLPDSVSVVMIDVDKFSSLAEKFSVSSIPKLFILHKGKVVSSIAGYYPIEEFEKWIKKYTRP